jgi:hypothetical protein
MDLVEFDLAHSRRSEPDWVLRSAVPSEEAVKLYIAALSVSVVSFGAVAPEVRQSKTELQGSWEGVYSVTPGNPPFKL